MPLKVLVVDDLPDIADTTAMVLTLLGFEVCPAYSGPDALAAVAADPPDAVVFDLGMPNMDGVRLARALRWLATPRRRFLVAVTAYSDAAHRQRAADVGADAYLVKPADPTALADLLRRPQPSPGGRRVAAGTSIALAG